MEYKTKQKLEVTLMFMVFIGAMVGSLIMINSIPKQEDQTALIIIKPFLSGPVGSITQVTIKQYTGGSWITRGTISVSGGSVTVYANQNTRFEVTVYLDHAYAATTAQAKAYTRVYLTITGEYSNQLMTANSATEVPDILWYVVHQWDWTDAGKPVASTTYSLSFEYQAYY